MPHGLTLLRRKSSLALIIAAITLMAMLASGVAQEWKSGIIWPQPPVVDPGPVGGPPSDAVVLFDGSDLSKFNGGERWKIENGYAICRGGGIATKESFGDCQLHIEWASPSEVSGAGQGRGNSGVYLMGKYEVQILDSYHNKTYFDGQCGAIYKQQPPAVNVCRPPGEWQTYDIIFRGPRFDSDGKLLKLAYVTVLHNGVLIQDHFEIQGTSAWDSPPEYEPHAQRLPLDIQNHGNPVRFRNIWIREIPQLAGKRP
jgi:hypothetical protein